MNEPQPILPDGFRLHRRATVGSTNDEAKALASDGAPEYTLVWADRQTAGRGRRGRAWVSPPGNLYLSLVLRPGGPALRAAQLGFVAAVAVGDALALGRHADARYKWPNDLLIGGRKVAGILLESATGATRAVDFVVIGIGVNLASAPADSEFPATSLLAEGSVDISPAALLEQVVHCLAGWHRRWLAEGFAPVRAAWLARATGVGEAVRVRLERDTLTGRFADLDADGALVLDAAGGRRHIAAGEVFPAA